MRPANALVLCVGILLAAPTGAQQMPDAAPAKGQAAAVASAILGSPERHASTPYFWSDQFGLRLQMVGTTTGWSTVELDGDPASFIARYVDPEGKPVAVLLGNRSAEVAAARRELARAA